VTTRIMLADMPRRLRDIMLAVLDNRPDVTLVAGEGGLIAALTAAQADAVVVESSDPAALAAIDPALARIANLTVLAIGQDGRSACIHRIRAETQVVTDVSPQGIVAALMGGASGTPDKQ
jgi:hypothetical protein